MWDAGFWHVGGIFQARKMRVSGSFGREKWREMGGDVWRWLTSVKGAKRLFLSPATSDSRR